MDKKLIKCFNNSHSEASGEKTSDFIKSFVILFRKSIKDNCKITINPQYLANGLMTLVKTNNDPSIVRNKERCKEAVIKTLAMPDLSDK